MNNRIYDGWFWDVNTKDFYRWDDLPGRVQRMWVHECAASNAIVAVPEGKRCPACLKQNNS